jgi:hypothetical protein
MTRIFEFTNGLLTSACSTTFPPGAKKLYTFTNGVLTNVEDTSVSSLTGKKLIFENGFLVGLETTGSIVGTNPIIPYYQIPKGTFNTVENIDGASNLRKIPNSNGIVNQGEPDWQRDGFYPGMAGDYLFSFDSRQVDGVWHGYMIRTNFRTGAEDLILFDQGDLYYGDVFLAYVIIDEVTGVIIYQGFDNNAYKFTGEVFIYEFKWDTLEYSLINTYLYPYVQYEYELEQLEGVTILNGAVRMLIILGYYDNNSGNHFEDYLIYDHSSNSFNFIAGPTEVLPNGNERYSDIDMAADMGNGTLAWDDSAFINFMDLRSGNMTSVQYPDSPIPIDPNSNSYWNMYGQYMAPSYSDNSVYISGGLTYRYDPADSISVDYYAKVTPSGTFNYTLFDTQVSVNAMMYSKDKVIMSYNPQIGYYSGSPTIFFDLTTNTQLFTWPDFHYSYYSLALDDVDNGIIANTFPYPSISSNYQALDTITTGTVSATDPVGVTVTGLIPGNWYAIESTGGPFYAWGGDTSKLDYGIMVKNGASDWPSLGYPYFGGGWSQWQSNGEMRLGYCTVDGYGLNTPAEGTNNANEVAAYWGTTGASAVILDSHYARGFFKASGSFTSVSIRVLNDYLDDNSGTIGYILKNATADETSIRPNIYATSKYFLDGTYQMLFSSSAVSTFQSYYYSMYLYQPLLKNEIIEINDYSSGSFNIVY